MKVYFFHPPFTLLPIKLSPFFLHLPLNDDGSSNALLLVALLRGCAYARDSNSVLLLIALVLAYAHDSSSVRLRFFC